ncbi:hypothetical protein BDZ88DRAFT_415032 [Geranomyces variabilis]|nr:hypothetical protein BDZ88DRAFT_415032 [Geranomyces variabilis]
MIGQTITLLVSTAALVIGNSNWIVIPVDPPWYQQLAAFAVGIAVQVALNAPLEAGRRFCQVLFAVRLRRTGMSHREMLTAWSTIYSNNFRGIEDPHIGQGYITSLLMSLYLIEAVAIGKFGNFPQLTCPLIEPLLLCIGSIGSLYYTIPVPFIKATGHMPAWGPNELIVTSQNDASITYQAAQDAFLSGTRLYDPLVADGLLMPPEPTCPNSTSTAGWHTGCASIVASSLTVPNIQNKAMDEQELPWVQIVPGDIFEGTVSTVGVTATCGPMEDVITYFNATTVDGYYVELPVENGDTLRNPVSLYGASEDYFVTPNVQILTMGHGANHFEPFLDDDSAMWVGIVAYNFDKPFADLTTRTMPLNAYTNRSLSFGLCKLNVNVGAAHARVLVNYTEPTRVSTLLSAIPLGTPRLFDMRNDSFGFGNSASGYGVAHFLFQALQEVSCDMVPCAFASTSPPGFNLWTGLVKGAIDGSVWTVDYENQLPTIADAVARLCALFLSSYVKPSSTFDLDVSSITTVTTNRRMIRVHTNDGCNIILSIGVGCAVIMLALTVLGHLTTRGFCWYLSPRALWLTESVYSLLRAVSSLPPSADEEDEVDAPRDMRQLAEQRTMYATVDSVTGCVRLRVKASKQGA